MTAAPTPEQVAAARRYRYRLTTHYIGAQMPTVQFFDTCSEALDEAEHRHRCHAGVACTMAEPVKVKA